MEQKKIAAIVRIGVVEKVERCLRDIGVPGMTVTHVKGFGEYANFFAETWMSAHARIEIFAAADQAQVIVDAIVETAHTGTAGDGIVVVLPVENVFRIRDGALAAQALWPKR